MSNPPRPWNFSAVAAPKVLLLFAPADRRWRRRSGSASGSGGVRAVAAARAARRAALKTVKKVLTARLGTGTGRQGSSEARHWIDPGSAQPVQSVRWRLSGGSRPSPYHLGANGSLKVVSAAQAPHDGSVRAVVDRTGCCTFLLHGPPAHSLTVIGCLGVHFIVGADLDVPSLEAVSSL